MAKSFGRDEMNDLLGAPSGHDEMASFRPTVATQATLIKKKNGPKAEPDIASMTPSETAAMLMEKSSISRQGPISSRHRTSRVLAHHELAKELLQESQRKKPPNSTHQSKGDGTDSEGSFIARLSTTGSGNNARIARRPRRATFVRRKDHSIYASSSSDNEDDRSKPRRTEDSDSSSDDDDKEDEFRRQRLLANRKIREAEIVKPKSIATTKSSPAPSETRPVQPPAPTTQLRSQSDVGVDSDHSSSEDSATSSNTSSSDSDSSEEQVRAKPIFVPKHLRKRIQSDEQKWKVEEARLERENGREHNRKLESRAMVARQVTTAEVTTADGLIEESYGATNDIPDDVDESDADIKKPAIESWELREVGRLLTVLRQEEERVRGRLEYDRRRRMTDNECMQEDIDAGLYNAPGRNQTGGKDSTHRFHHRGSYYMNEDEFDENDVRFKAAEYAAAKTGEYKLDKSQLSDMLRRNKFGFAHQNTKYKGVTAEHTSDKQF